MGNELGSAAFAEWLDRYKAAWEARDPDQAAALFTPDATYRETPYDAPFAGREEIAEYWRKAVSGQKDVTFTSEVLGWSGDTGLCHWHAAFTGIEGGEAIDLDGIFRCRFDPSGLVREFEEWWHIRIVPPQD